MGLFDGLQVGGGPTSDGMGGGSGGGDALSSGLFAGLTIASSASPSVGVGDEETESLTPASIMPSPMESLASEATATPISLPPETELSPLPSLDDAKDAPAAKVPALPRREPGQEPSGAIIQPTAGHAQGQTCATRRASA